MKSFICFRKRKDSHTIPPKALSWQQDDWTWPFSVLQLQCVSNSTYLKGFCRFHLLRSTSTPSLHFFFLRSCLRDSAMMPAYGVIGISCIPKLFWSLIVELKWPFKTPNDFYDWLVSPRFLQDAPWDDGSDVHVKPIGLRVLRKAIKIVEVRVRARPN